ncbi:MAG: ATP-dependent dethiobiotin synthetase BioD [Chitinophagales bacterium]|nr:MAG: ATP-dependent dethiobiotin synthetase BioD [Chitinophagales bacterium]
MNIFVSGIDTGVGKTIVSAILCEALYADYWKPVQSGNLSQSDTQTVRKLITNPHTVLHPEAWRLKLPASPHKAARAEKKIIRLHHIRMPQTSRYLIIEGAGGLLVPLNHSQLIIDLIQRWNIPVILVSRNYLGSINHTLLSAEALKSRGIRTLGIIFNGSPDPENERVIIKMSGMPCIGRIRPHRVLTRRIIASYAAQFRPGLLTVIRRKS